MYVIGKFEWLPYERGNERKKIIPNTFLLKKISEELFDCHCSRFRTKMK